MTGVSQGAIWIAQLHAGFFPPNPRKTEELT
jgi:hypothetical protein